MSVPVTTTFGAVDPLLEFTTPNNFIATLNEVVTSSIPTDLTPYVIGSAVPSVDQQGLVWQRLDAAGRPLGTYVFYNGFWTLPTPTPGARLGYFAGDPTVFFDGTGLGLPGPGPVAYDYWGWAIANGNNSTGNLSDKFIVLGRMDNVGITGWDTGSHLWRTNITGAPLTIGGATDITTDATNTYRPARPAARQVSPFATSDTRSDSGDLYGTIGDGTHTNIDILAADAGNLTPAAIPIIPPFFALALIAWIDNR